MLLETLKKIKLEKWRIFATRKKKKEKTLRFPLCLSLLEASKK
jgi:hypothetical protein